MSQVQTAIEALSNKNAFLRLRFNHVKIAWPLPLVNQQWFVELTGEIELSIETEDTSGSPAREKRKKLAREEGGEEQEAAGTG